MPDKTSSLTPRLRPNSTASRELHAISFDSVTPGLPPKLEDTPGSGSSRGSTPASSRTILPTADAAKSSSSLKLGSSNSPRPSSIATSRRSSAHATSAFGQVPVATSSSTGENPLHAQKGLLLSGEIKRDSGVATSLSTMGDFAPSTGDTAQLTVPAIVLHEDNSGSSSKAASSPPSGQPNELEEYAQNTSTRSSNEPFHGITTTIESGELEDIFAADSISFSKRGSLLWGKDKSNAFRESKTKQLAASKVDRTHGTRDSRAQKEESLPATNGMTAEERRLSKRVRSMYEYGDEAGLQWLADPNLRPPPDTIEEETVDNGSARLLNIDTPAESGSPSSHRKASRHSASISAQNKRASTIKKNAWEIAGGIEDWTDVESRDVDRYGFIRTKVPVSRGSSRLSTPVPPQGPEGQSSNLSPIAEGFLGDQGNRPVTPTTPNMSHTSLSTSRADNVHPPSRRKQPLSPSMFSGRTNTSQTSSFKRRSFSRQSRRLAEARNILDLAPQIGIQTYHSRVDTPRTAAVRASKERKRENKWQKMAIPVHRSANTSQEENSTIGAGTTEYAFNTADPKLISRAWKGIPDRWRAAAWRSFLLSSSKKHLGASAPSDAVLVADYHSLQEQDCADDVQIDMDVPRTISGHVMFRSRYRGGQRLMFRLLHALSLKFPETGYVQGMAPLAATLLCYYDEEMAFTMAVRMWMLRGLQFLYSPGFQGLMSTLDELESKWLKKGDIKRSLNTLGISAMSYATKWYLTLLNHTLPFSAQLRVWDVFMLLGDPIQASISSSKKGLQPDFSVLHAVATSLMDGMHEVIVDAEFENAMGILTSAHGFVDDDVLMNVARKLYRDHAR